MKDRLCEMDRRGQKNGAGFYDYDENRVPSPAPVAGELFAEFAARAGITQRDISDDEILERCVLPMVNEGAKILEEGIAIRASDIDVGLCLWLRLAGLSRWTHALRQHPGPGQGCCALAPLSTKQW